MMAAQVELRQHVWRRSGVVAWAGVGTVFSHFDEVHRNAFSPISV